MKNMEFGKSPLRANRIICKGFTIAELMLVVVILAIAAMMAIPFATSGSSTQLKSAATIIASDLEYAKSMAITKGTPYWVVFNTGAESYQIEDTSGPIDHPVKNGSLYVINFASDTRLDQVDISNASFDGYTRVGFNYLGSPLNGSGNPLNSGVITLGAGGGTITVNVEPVTGYITITD